MAPHLAQALDELRRFRGFSRRGEWLSQTSSSRHPHERQLSAAPAFEQKREGIYFSVELFENARMSKTDFDPEYVFSHHAATPEKHAHYNAIHEGAKRFAEVILGHVPECSDRVTALSLLRESAMIACAAVALDGRLK